MAYAIVKDPAKRKNINGIECVYMMTKYDGTEVYIPIDGMKAQERKCQKCGYSGSALQEHHVHGRKNSDETVTLCANCHFEFHKEYGWKL